VNLETHCLDHVCKCSQSWDVDSSDALDTPSPSAQLLMSRAMSPLTAHMSRLPLSSSSTPPSHEEGDQSQDRSLLNATMRRSAFSPHVILMTDKQPHLRSSSESSSRPPFCVPASPATPVTKPLFQQWKDVNFMLFDALQAEHRYIIHSQIAESMFGLVVLAYDLIQKCCVAIKISNLTYVTSHHSMYGGTVLEDIDNEAKAIRYLSQLPIPSSLGYRPVACFVQELRDKLYHYLVTEFLPFGTLTTVHGQLYNNRSIPEEKVRVYMNHLILALEWIHQHGVSHCDMSPQNICVGELDRIYLIDFGVMIFTNSQDNHSSHTATIPGTSPQVPNHHRQPYGKVRGKIPYNSPELYQGMHWDSFANDVFAVGVIAFMLITGTAPFNTADTNDPAYVLISSPEWLCASCIAYHNDRQISLHALQFMNSILKPQSIRLSIQQLIQHAWFTNPLHASTPVPPSLPASTPVPLPPSTCPSAAL